MQFYCVRITDVSLKKGLVSLGSVRQEDETHILSTFTQGQKALMRHHLKYGKQVPEGKACSDGILALTMHMIAKEISKHLQTLMAALRGDGHHT